MSPGHEPGEIAKSANFAQICKCSIHLYSFSRFFYIFFIKFFKIILCSMMSHFLYLVCSIVRRVRIKMMLTVCCRWSLTGMSAWLYQVNSRTGTPIMT